MDSLEYIEDYFNEKLNPEEKTAFEKKIIADPAFAEEVGFYLSSKQVIATTTIEQKERFKKIYKAYKEEVPGAKQSSSVIRRLWPWAAAAAILAGIIFGWYTWFQSPSSGELTDNYIKENFQTLPVTMGTREDSLQVGLRFYNSGRFEESLRQFESMALRDSSFSEAKKYAGIVCLRLEQYDKAINYFVQLENNSQLYVNPGKFYRALAFMKRNLPGDTDTAKNLLQQVVENDLEGKKDAEQWLKKW